MSCYGVTEHCLNGVKIRATGPEWNLTQGEVIFQRVGNGNRKEDIELSECFANDIMTSLQFALGFNLTLQMAKGWASQLSNGSWFGMAQQVIDGDADISVAKVSITPKRVQHLQHLIPTHGQRLKIFLVQPSHTNYGTLLKPFTLDVWVTFVSTCAIFASIPYLFRQMSKSIQNSFYKNIYFGQFMIWNCNSVVHYGFLRPNLLSSGILVLTVIFSSFILTSFYSCQLVSLFSSQPLPIQSFLDVLKSGMGITLDQNSERAHEVINAGLSAQDETSLLLQKYLKKANVQEAHATQGGDIVFRKGGAFITYTDNFYITTIDNYDIDDKEYCERLSSFPVTTTVYKSGLFIRKNSSLKEPFNRKIITLYTSGLLKKYTAKYERVYFSPCGSAVNMIPLFGAITFSDVFIAGAVLATAIITSVAAFLLEFGTYLYYSK